MEVHSGALQHLCVCVFHDAHLHIFSTSHYSECISTNNVSLFVDIVPALAGAPSAFCGMQDTTHKSSLNPQQASSPSKMSGLTQTLKRAYMLGLSCPKYQTKEQAKHASLPSSSWHMASATRRCSSIPYLEINMYSAMNSCM